MLILAASTSVLADPALWGRQSLLRTRPDGTGSGGGGMRPQSPVRELQQRHMGSNRGRRKSKTAVTVRYAAGSHLWGHNCTEDQVSSWCMSSLMVEIKQRASLGIFEPHKHSESQSPFCKHHSARSLCLFRFPRWQGSCQSPMALPCPRMALSMPMVTGAQCCLSTRGPCHTGTAERQTG